MAILRALLTCSLLARQAVSALLPIPQSSWTVTADSYQTGNEPAKAIDGNANTFWLSQSSASLPHWLLIDLGSTYNIQAVAYNPRQDGSATGRVGAHTIEISTDGKSWGSPVATGSYFNDATVKTTTFVRRTARYVRFTATSEAQGTGSQVTSCSEVNIYHDVAYLSNSGWTATTDSSQSGNPAANTIDGNTTSFWHTMYSPSTAPLPHYLQIDAGSSITTGGLAYLPRQDGGKNGNIGNFSVQISNDGKTWTQVASGVWADDQNEKAASFQATARYFKLNGLTEAGNRGTWSSAAEVNLLATTETQAATPAASKGIWQNTVDFPIIPVATAMLPNGKVLLWASFNRFTFGGTNGFTQTAIYDPATGLSTQRTVSNTKHDMFCPGISVDFNGRVVVTGGDDAPRTSIYDPSSDTWISGPDMQIARGYQASATMSDGRIFTIGGSWSGGKGGKNGESYDPAANTWSLNSKALVSPMMTADSRGAFRADNHGWLFGWQNGTVFQAGPSKAMNWYDTTGDGSVTGAKTRSDDGDAMNGNAVMFDAVAGKILTAGGAPDYDNSNARTNAYVITLGAVKAAPQVTKVPNMSYARAFANGVVLPDGTVFVVGGQSFAVPFTDTTAQYTPELFNPTTNSWTQLSPMAIPRTYHSTALLLPDATIISAGGGLCGSTCTTNHFDGEIFIPPYLLNSDGSRRSRPSITNVASSVAVGGSLTVTTSGSVSKFSLIRLGSSTHTVDTDQRRIPLTPTGSAGSYSVTVPSDPGVALPGYWYLFAIDSNGTPSVAKVVKVTALTKK